jgi:iron complex outermembrane recepter protein
MERNRFANIALFAFAHALSFSAPAFAEFPRFSIDIPAGELTAGLDQLAQQLDAEFIYSPEQLRGVDTKGVQGQFTAELAVTKLLEGTRLTVTHHPSGALLIGTRPNLPKQTSAEDLNSTSRRSALADQNAQRTTENSKGDREKKPHRELEEVTVTGTHIRGRAVTAAPSLTISQTDIRRTGYVTVPALFESLPQNFDTVSLDGSIATDSSQLANSAFEEPVSAIDLRGLGPQATLVLLNGQRRAGGLRGRAVDVSTIPTSAIERIDIVTGGASAIYGSDAVAGVVNFVLRKTYNGAESQAYYGAGSGDLSTLQLSQTFGREAEDGGFVFAYDYAENSPLDIVKTGLVVSPSVAGLINNRLYVTPDDRKHAAYLAGEYRPTAKLELSWDALYTRKNHTNIADYTVVGCCENDGHIRSTVEQLSGSATAAIDLGPNWNWKWAAAHTQTEADTVVEYFDSPSVRSPQAKITSLSSIVNGPLFEFSGREIRAAFGLEGRKESNSSPGVAFPNITQTTVDASRHVRSAFAEMSIPLIEGGAKPSLRQLELSLSGRYDRYSDFGSTFNPQAGLIWGLGGGITIRGSRAEAFRAPDLYALTQQKTLYLFSRPDPSRETGRRPVLVQYGGSPDLEPEKATGWNFTIDYHPPFTPGFGLSASYFNIEYRDRIDVSAGGADDIAVLQRPQFESLLNRSPTAEDVAARLADSAFFRNVTRAFANCAAGAYCSPDPAALLVAFPDVVLFDNRTNNLKVETIEGLDVVLSGDVETDLGAISFGLNSTYTLNHERRVTPESEPVSLIDRVGTPVALRARANGGLKRGDLGAYVYLNYIDSYGDPLSSQPSTISSWTTVDLSLQSDGLRFFDSHLLRTLQATLSINNLFDRDPPVYLRSAQGLRYDSANANPIGRFAALRVSVTW